MSVELKTEEVKSELLNQIDETLAPEKRKVPKDIKTLKKELKFTKTKLKEAKEELEGAITLANDNFQYAEQANKKTEELNELLAKERQTRRDIIENFITIFNNIEGIINLGRKAVERELQK